MEDCEKNDDLNKPEYWGIQQISASESYRIKILNNIADMANTNGHEFIEVACYIVYAIVAFCWGGFCEIGISGYKGNPYLLIGLILGFVYIAIDLYRYVSSLLKFRKLYRQFSKSVQSVSDDITMYTISEDTFTFVVIEIVVFILLVLMMIIFLLMDILIGR